MPAVKEGLIDRIRRSNPNAQFFDGLDQAIVGMGYRSAALPVAVYDLDLIKRLVDDEFDLDEWSESNLLHQVHTVGSPILLVRG